MQGKRSETIRTESGPAAILTKGKPGRTSPIMKEEDLAVPTECLAHCREERGGEEVALGTKIIRLGQINYLGGRADGIRLSKLIHGDDGAM